MAPTVQSYVIAAPNAIVLPTSNAHHAHPSPRRKAVAVMAIATSANATMYAPYNRKSSLMNSAVVGDVSVSSDHERLGEALVTGSQDWSGTWSGQALRH